VIDDILARLEKVRRTGPNNWLACCPAHEDKSPSFTLHANPDGRILANCFSGCSFPDIVEAVGLGWEPWFPPKQSADYLPPIKHAFPAADVLKALADEADILCVVLHDSDWGLPLKKVDIERAQLAIERIRAARSLALGR
jgi:hypothetical protein